MTTNLTELIGFFSIFKEIQDLEKLVNWLKNNVGAKIILNDSQKIFSGYHFFVSLMWEGFAYQLMSSEIFNLNEDRTYSRGIFYQGIEIQDIPITCERTAFGRYLFELGTSIRKAKDYDEMKIAFGKIEPLMKFLDDLLQSKIQFKKVTRKEGIRISFIYTLYTFYHNAQSNSPYVFKFNLNKTQDYGFYMNKSIIWFLYCLYYIWSLNLNPEEMATISLNTLPLLADCFELIGENKKDYFLFRFFCATFIDDSREENSSFIDELFNLNIKKKRKSKKKESIGKIFTPLKDLLNKNQNDYKIQDWEREFYPKYKKNIESGEKVYQDIKNILKNQQDLFSFEKVTLFANSNSIKNGSLDILDLPNASVEKLITKDFLEKYKTVKEPDLSNPAIENVISGHFWENFDYYYNKITPLIEKYEQSITYGFSTKDIILKEKPLKKSLKPFLKPIEKIIIKLSDTEADILKKLDAKMYWYQVEVLESSSSIYNGVTSFCSTLIGNIELKQTKDQFEKPEVMIIRHPDGKRVSLALLIDAYGNISDYSGWLIFLNCATYGYHGFGPNQFRFALDIIEKYRSQLKIEEIQINETVFLKYLFEIKEKDGKKLDYTASKQKFNTKLGDFKGKLLEAIVFKWICYTNRKFDVFWNEYLDHQEIDVYSVNTHSQKVTLYECKFAVHSDAIQSILKNLTAKSTALGKKYPKFEIEQVLLVYDHLKAERKGLFEQSNIRVMDNFRDTIRTNSAIFQKNSDYIRHFDENI